ncbi:hypothetical protein K437DRAFT_254603 [Tilletiaria anomala UBC 951]|uniref:Uncharacterized protein n=1 Tax=Tilletiaria anomala (strain ATCC 24038 / CBS 436.72 / UBC 951) TaxID=1037660 RepID=A0A066WDM4_TILAU|nr:uncharacterized protein K437DRAFT_254603 [Tilletiaria anomala UBC 951]KDN52052.1 hypothetical protein K437DRAFT_254603 [Tilletiaria anomala UBC 951]
MSIGSPPHCFAPRRVEVMMLAIRALCEGSAAAPAPDAVTATFTAEQDYVSKQPMRLSPYLSGCHLGYREHYCFRRRCSGRGCRRASARPFRKRYQEKRRAAQQQAIVSPPVGESGNSAAIAHPGNRYAAKAIAHNWHEEGRRGTRRQRNINVKRSKSTFLP